MSEFALLLRMSIETAHFQYRFLLKKRPFPLKFVLPVSPLLLHFCTSFYSILLTVACNCQVADCSILKNCTGKCTGGDHYNAMVHPYTVGPMTVSGFTWYQGAPVSSVLSLVPTWIS